MSETVIIALIASIAPTAAAIAALFVGLRNAKKANTIIEKTVEIHELTNSNLARVNHQLESANAKIESLEKIVTALNARRERRR